MTAGGFHMDISLEKFKEARERIQPYLHKTPLTKSTTFSLMAGGEIYLKYENLQKTGSFKIRGACNKIFSLVKEGELKHVVAASAGNHALGVAYAALKSGISATIVMPEAAPRVKIDSTETLGAKVVLHGDCFDAAYDHACKVCEEENAVFIHPYNDIDVITGQGTMALEILEQLPSADIIIVPAGGGGLLAGVATAAKKINPDIKVYGVQAETANAISQSYHNKSLTYTETAGTIADGIAVKRPGEKDLELILKNADGILEVSDLEIASAVFLLLERCKVAVEPAGATPVAAVLSKIIDVTGKKVVCLLSGGNIDVSLIHKMIEIRLNETTL